MIPAADPAPVIAACARAFGVPISAIVGRDLTKRSGTARGAAAWIMYVLGDLSHEKIGKALGGRTRWASIGSVARTQRRLQTRRPLYREISMALWFLEEDEAARKAA